MSDLPTGTPAPSSTGMAPNVAAALSYLFPPFGGILFFLIEKESRFVRFHAAQAIVVGVGLFAAWIAFYVVAAVLNIVPVLGALVSVVLWAALAFGGFALWLLLTFRAYQGQEWEVPMAGEYARKLLASPAPHV